MVNPRVINALVLVTFWSVFVALMFNIYLHNSTSGISLQIRTSKNSSIHVQGRDFTGEDKVHTRNHGKLFKVALLKNSSVTPLPRRRPSNKTLEATGVQKRLRSRSSTRRERKHQAHGRGSLGRMSDRDASEESEGAEVQMQARTEKVWDSYGSLAKILDRGLTYGSEWDQARETKTSAREESVKYLIPGRSLDRSSDTKLYIEDKEEDVQKPARQGQVVRDRIKRPRPPKCLIVGFSKCGTDALKGFLSLHPDIVAPLREVDFFTNYYVKGLDWYREQMPPSWVSQVTIEKTPEYILTREVLHRIHEYNSSMRLIVMIRDPIVRLQSLYLHDLVHKPEYSKDTTFKEWCGGRAHTAHVASIVDYATHIRDAFDIFSRRQVLVQSEEDLEESPIKVLRTVESFLCLRRAFSTDNIVYNEKKGFYCFNMTTSTFAKASQSVHMNENTGCFRKAKGRPHSKIEPRLYRELVEFIRPYNQRLFELLGRTITWENFK